jgi:hypothetical protein
VARSMVRARMIGAVLSCLACLTSLGVVGLGAIGLGAWVGRLDLAQLPLLVVLAALAVYRHRTCGRRAR